MGMRAGTLPAAALLVAAGLAQAGGIYKWTDADGNVHYGERPPPGAESREMAPAPPPPAGDVETSRQRLDRLLERQQRSDMLRRESIENARREREQDEAQAQVRKARCQAAKTDLEFLNEQRPVYYVDEKGERRYLDDREREEAKARLRREITTWCE